MRSMFACAFSRSERVCVITDEATHRDRGRDRAPNSRSSARPITPGCWKNCAARPLSDLPREILDDLETSQVSIFAVQAQTNELRSRIQMTDVVNRRKIRHAHMVNINRQIMLEGMRADFQRVDRLSQKVVEMVRKASKHSGEDRAGTDLTADLNPNYKWLKTSGIISPEKWGNLPGGEIFTTPGEVNGTFVIDGVVGDYLCAKFGRPERQSADHPHEGKPAHRGPLGESRTGERFLEVHPHRREQRPRRRIRHRHKHRFERCDRADPAGRKISRRPHRIRQSLRRAHRRGLGFHHAHRCRRPKVQIWVDDQQIMRDGKFLVEA